MTIHGVITSAANSGKSSMKSQICKQGGQIHGKFHQMSQLISHKILGPEIIKLDPGRAGQNSLATAVTNFTKLYTSQVQAYFQDQYYLDLGL